MTSTRPVYIVDGARIPFVKSMTAYAKVSSQALMTEPLKALRERYRLDQIVIGDLAVGAVMQSASNWNFGRECALEAGIHPHTPAYAVQRACGTSLETTLQIALKIAHGQIEDGMAGGVDTNSDLPIEVSQGLRDVLLALNAEKTLIGKLKVLSRLRPKDLSPKVPMVKEPRTGLSMGEHCELMVKEWQIPRAEQDQLTYQSHQKAHAAYEAGFYDRLVVPFGGLKRDGILRGDTSLEKLAKLKPVFDPSRGTLTAGNSTALTDGAACVLLASGESLSKHGWKAKARFVDAQASALDFVHGDGLLMAPTVAVGKLLARNKLKLQDFDFYEIHEAFAGQVLCTLEAWKSQVYCAKYLGISEPLGAIEPKKINIAGGSVALGHPFGATGARLVATLSEHLTKHKGPGRGLISVCTGGGMGVAAILETA